MNLFRFNAMISEFPFVAETVMKREDGSERQLSYLDYIQIRRADRDILYMEPRNDSWDGSVVGIDEWTRVDLVLSDGSIIRGAVRQAGQSGSNYAHSDTHTWKGETVLEAIYRHGLAETLQCIVVVEGGYNVVDHYSMKNFRATVYKPSKEFTWQQVIDEAQEKALAEVRQEADF